MTKTHPRILALIVTLFLLLGHVFPTAAQEDRVVPYELFWIKLDESNTLLLQYLEALPEGATVKPDDLNKIWENVVGVVLPDGSVIEIDTSWIMFDNVIDRETIETTQARVEALLLYWLEESGYGSDQEEMLRRLRALMQRYQYQTQQQNAQTTQPTRITIGTLAETILLILGILAAAAVVAYLLRDLQVQSAAVANEQEIDDLPTTSAAADQLALESEGMRDYRAAIRYLYLSTLLSLDERGMINFDPGLTNTEHLRQLKDKPQLRQLLSGIVNIFDHVWYGFAPADEHLYQDFRRQVDQLKQVR